MRSILIVGNQTLAGPELEAVIRQRLGQGPASFHVVVPATPLAWGLTWDELEAETAARERLSAFIDRLRDLGADASGEIGARDPVAAVRDAMRGRVIDEIVLSTLPPGLSRWLGQDVPSRLKGSVSVPVTVVTAEKAPLSRTPA